MKAYELTVDFTLVSTRTGKTVRRVSKSVEMSAAEKRDFCKLLDLVKQLGATRTWEDRKS